MKFEIEIPKQTFRNYSHFEEAEFINDIQSNDLLNGRRREVNWDDWKSAFLCVSDKHAPIKTYRLKGEIKSLDDEWYR